MNRLGIVLPLMVFAVSAQAGGPPKCTCLCNGDDSSHIPKPVCSLYYIDGENSMELGNDLAPGECIAAISRPPCVGKTWSGPEPFGPGPDHALGSISTERLR
jgi:hypothetical protein